MNRRSLLLLLAILCLACVGLFVLLGRQDALARPVEAGVSVELSPASATRETELQAEALDTTHGARSPPHLGTPHTPARGALGAGEGRIAGWLRPQEDKPWRDASVALLACADGCPPAVLAESRCEPEGGFTLGSGREGRALFVVLARGYVPRVQEVELAHGREQLLEDLELDRGALIAGALSTNAKPLARFEVVAVDERELPVVKLQGGELFWNGPGFDWRFTTAESGADGRYAIGGLHAGDYAVRVSTCRGPLSSLCSGERAPRPVRAPRAGVDFAFESSALALHFASAGQPLAGVEVELACGGWRSGKQSDAQGVAAFQLVPRLDCTLYARKPGYADLRLPVSAPASGGCASESFEMTARAPAPEVHILVHAPSGEAPPDLRVRLFRMRTRGAAPIQEPLLDAQLRCTPASAAANERDFVLPPVAAGSYSALLLPGQPWNHELDASSYIGTHCAIELAIEVPNDGAVRTHVTTERRAALRLQFPDESGHLLPARCTLRDESGAELGFVLVDPAQGLPLTGRELSTLGPTLLYAAQCSGSAKLLVEYGDRTLFSGRCEFRPGLVAAVLAQR
jgi:hypothetical protein